MVLRGGSVLYLDREWRLQLPRRPSPISLSLSLPPPPSPQIITITQSDALIFLASGEWRR